MESFQELNMGGRQLADLSSSFCQPSVQHQSNTLPSTLQEGGQVWSCLKCKPVLPLQLKNHVITGSITWRKREGAGVKRWTWYDLNRKKVPLLFQFIEQVSNVEQAENILYRVKWEEPTEELSIALDSCKAFEQFLQLYRTSRSWRGAIVLDVVSKHSRGRQNASFKTY